MCNYPIYRDSLTLTEDVNLAKLHTLNLIPEYFRAFIIVTVLYLYDYINLIFTFEVFLHLIFTNYFVRGAIDVGYMV